jgi:high-affinity Fe2+/Pb2+ permease
MGAIKRIGGWIKRDKDMILALLCGILATQLNNIIRNNCDVSYIIGLIISIILGWLVFCLFDGILK